MKKKIKPRKVLGCISLASGSALFLDLLYYLNVVAFVVTVSLLLIIAGLFLLGLLEYDERQEEPIDELTYRFDPDYRKRIEYFTHKSWKEI